MVMAEICRRVTLYTLDRISSLLLHGRYIQLFRERLSEKVHATISKGIVGGFEFTPLIPLSARNLAILFFWPSKNVKVDH